MMICAPVAVLSIQHQLLVRAQVQRCWVLRIPSSLNRHSAIIFNDNPGPFLLIVPLQYALQTNPQRGPSDAVANIPLYTVVKMLLL